jgi:hypothetical protein
MRAHVVRLEITLRAGRVALTATLIEPNPCVALAGLLGSGTISKMPIVTASHKPIITSQVTLRTSTRRPCST